MIASPADVVEHGQQLDQDAGQGELAHGGPVPVDPLAVVGILSLNPLQVGRALGQLHAEIVGRAFGPDGSVGCAAIAVRSLLSAVLRLTLAGRLPGSGSLLAEAAGLGRRVLAWPGLTRA